MIENFPTWINIFFIVTAIATILFFHYANGRPKRITLFITIWAILHSVLAYYGFYTNTEAMPPRFAFILIPIAVFVTLGCLQKSWSSTSRNMVLSTLLHSVRIPVEIVLYLLFTHKMVPELMTFAGRNFDIVAGITAPLVAYLFARGGISRKALLYWNIIGLGLVSFIMVNGILSAELPFQQFAFDQPNRGIAYFPYVLLPAVIVPIVVYTHISDIILLINRKR